MRHVGSCGAKGCRGLSGLFLLALWLLAGAFVAEAQEGLPVVEAGAARAVIVRNTEGGRVAALAATELRDHIADMTGVRLPMVRADQWERSPGQTALIVGGGELLRDLGVELGDLPREGFRLLAVPEHQALVIAGRDSGNPFGTAAAHNRDQEFGTLYAVYELLEQWGVRWLFPGARGTVVPRSASLTAPRLDVTDAPDFFMRNFWPDAFTADGTPGALGAEDPAVAAAAEAARLWALRNRAGNSSADYHTRHHSPTWWELWSETHPEYLGLFRGQRGWRRNPPGAVPDRLLARSKLCVGNPRVAEAVADLAIEAFRASDRRRSYSICEQDGSGGFCTCRNCIALDALAEGELPYGDRAGGVYVDRDRGALTDRYMVFWNRVAERVAAEFPDRYLGTYLYSIYSDLPRREQRLHPLLRAVYVNNGQVEPGELRRRIEGWGRLTPHPLAIYIPPMFGAWPLLDFARVTLPVFTLENVREGLRFCREQRVAGFRGTAGHFATNNVGSHGLLNYAYARWLWDADREAAEIRADFARHAFGPAAEVMRDYFLEIERRQNTFPRENGREAWLAHHLQVFTPEFVDGLMDRLGEALARVREDGDRDRVLIFRQNLVFTAAQLEAERAWKRFESGEAGIAAVIEAYRTCEALYGELWPENRPQQPFFRRGEAARAVALAPYYETLAVLSQEEWSLRADPHGEGMEQRWFEPGAEGDWRPVVMGGHDMHGLQGSDVQVWYRARFMAPADRPAAQLRLGFRVQNSSADLFLNGMFIGQQVLGESVYLEPELDGEGNLVSGQAVAGNAPFVYDIGGCIRPGEVNEFAVRIWGYTDRGVAAQRTWLLEERR